MMLCFLDMSLRAKTMFMGIDVRYAFLGFSYSTVGSGLYLRYLDNASNVGMNYLLIFSMALIGLGMLVTNRAFCMHFLSISWLLIQNDQDSNLIKLLNMSVSMRRKSAIVAGICAAVIFDDLTIRALGVEVISFFSLSAVFVIAIGCHFKWFYRRIKV